MRLSEASGLCEFITDVRRRMRGCTVSCREDLEGGSLAGSRLSSVRNVKRGEGGTLLGRFGSVRTVGGTAFRRLLRMRNVGGASDRDMCGCFEGKYWDGL